MKPAPLLFVALCLASATAAAPAHAQKPTIIDLDRAASDHADELFRAGNVLAKKDKWAEAEPLFRQAWALKRSYDIAGNLGIAEASLRRWRDAAEHLSFALQSFPANGKPEHKKLLDGTLAGALPEVATLTLKVTPEKAEVLVDGKSVGTAPLAAALFVEAGAVTITARRDGYLSARQTLTVAKGETREASLTLTPIGSATERRSVVPGAVLGSVAGAALVAGVVLVIEGAVKRGNAHDLYQSIAGHGTCVTGAANYDARCVQLNDTGRLSDRLHDAGVGVLIGAGAAATGTALYFLWPASRPRQTGAPRVVPTVSATSAGVLLSGSF